MNIFVKSWQELHNERVTYWNELMEKFEKNKSKKEFRLDDIEEYASCKKIISVKHGLRKSIADGHSNDNRRQFRNKYKTHFNKQYQSETDSVDSVSYVLKCKEQTRNSNKFKINNFVDLNNDASHKINTETILINSSSATTVSDREEIVDCRFSNNVLTDYKNVNNNNNKIIAPDLQEDSSSDDSDQMFFDKELIDKPKDIVNMVQKEFDLNGRISSDKVEDKCKDNSEGGDSEISNSLTGVKEMFFNHVNGGTNDCSILSVNFKENINSETSKSNGTNSFKKVDNCKRQNHILHKTNCSKTISINCSIDIVNKNSIPNGVVKLNNNDRKEKSNSIDTHLNNSRVEININSETQQVLKCTKHRRLQRIDIRTGCDTPIILDDAKTHDANHKNELNKYRKKLQTIDSKNINQDLINEVVNRKELKRKKRLKVIDAENIISESTVSELSSNPKSPKNIVCYDRFEMKNTETEGIFPCVFKSDKRRHKLGNEIIYTKRKRISPVKADATTNKICLPNVNKKSAKHILTPGSKSIKLLTLDYFLNEEYWNQSN